jgi:hypothetical protein
VSLYVMTQVALALADLRIVASLPLA